MKLKAEDRVKINSKEAEERLRKLSNKAKSQLKLSQEKKDYLKSIYFNPKNPGSYQSPKKLYDIVQKEKRFFITLKNIKEFLQTYESYGQFKNVKHNFQRSRVLVLGIDDQWDIDLADMSKYSEANDGYKYLLCAIDIFSRFAWVQPMINKTAEEIIKTFTIILSEGRKPSRLRSDAAKDFTSGKFQNFVKKEEIRHFTTNNEKQANFVERFIRTIKTKIFGFVIFKNSKRYIDSLQDIVYSYNHTFHQGIYHIPSQVNKKNEKQLWYQMYPPREYTDKRKRKKTFALEIGDNVRLSILRHKLSRSYDSKWTGEVFTIYARYKRQREPIYKVKDYFGVPLDGSLYESELLKVEKGDENPMFKIDKEIKRREKGGIEEVFVSWLGWPKKYNSWIEASTIQNIENDW